MTRNTFLSSGRLVGMFFISVLLLAFTGLFGVWYSHDLAIRSFDRLLNLATLVDAARECQVEFKTQVQLWKNTLIRGQAPADFTAYRDRLEAQDKTVDAALEKLRDSKLLPASLKPEVEALITEHEALHAAYHKALEAYSSSDPQSIFRVDQSVRGIDQSLNSRIDDLSEQLVGEGRKSRGELEKESNELYRILRIVSIAATLFSVACAGIVAWRSLQRPRQAA